MRQKQFEILERMLPLISRIHATEDEYYYIGELFENLSKNVQPQNTAIKYLEQLSNIRKQFNKEELPKDRQGLKKELICIYF